MNTINLIELSHNYPLSTHEHTLEPLWADDTGRNSNSGKYTGTFIGYFSQLVLEFGPTTKQQMRELRAMFDNPIIRVKYSDSKGPEDTFTEDFYGTAIKAKLDYWWGKYKSFSITLTAIEERE